MNYFWRTRGFFNFISIFYSIFWGFVNYYFVSIDFSWQKILSNFLLMTSFNRWISLFFSFVWFLIIFFINLATDWETTTWIHTTTSNTCFNLLINYWDSFFHTHARLLQLSHAHYVKLQQTNYTTIKLSKILLAIHTSMLNLHTLGVCSRATSRDDSVWNLVIPPPTICARVLDNAIPYSLICYLICST